MAMIFANLPVPAADGVGASVNVDALCHNRTITVNDGPDFEGLLFVEASADGGVNFTPVARFDSTSQRKILLPLGFNFARVRRQFFRPGGATPVVNIGAEQVNVFVYGALAIPAGDGVGAALDISGGGDLLSVLAAGTFNRAIFIEGSQDLGVTFARIDDFGKFETARAVSTRGAFDRVRVRSVQSGGGDSPVIMFASLNCGGGE